MCACKCRYGNTRRVFISKIVSLSDKRAFSYLDIVDEDLPEARGKHVLGVLAGSITDVWHLVLSLELPPHPVVNTFGLPPVPLKFVIAVRLVARELLRTLFDYLRAVCWSYRHDAEKFIAC